MYVLCMVSVYSSASVSLRIEPIQLTQSDIRKVAKPESQCKINIL